MSRTTFCCHACKGKLGTIHHDGYLDIAAGVKARVYGDCVILVCTCQAVRMVDLARLAPKAA